VNDVCPEEVSGTAFKPESLVTAQQRSWKLLQEIAAAIEPGMIEADALAMAKKKFEEWGIEKLWHATKIRFGKNTCCAFKDLSDPSVVLQQSDIFYLDLGPVFDEHEGDVGATFMLGDDPEHLRAIDDVKWLFDVIEAEWRQSAKSGHDLYLWAKNKAEEKGWILNIEGAGGHRVSDFPHALYHKGKLRDFKGTPSPRAWILEVLIRHPSRDFGAFYEDMLS
jgi:Xaa-Pro aminopeptidase